MSKTPEADELEALLEQVAAGNRAAFRLLYDRTAPILFGSCLRLMRDRERARDLLQEVMVRIWQKSALYSRAKGSVMTWMITVTRNCAFDRLAATPAPTASLSDESILALAEAASPAGDPWVATGVRRCLEKLSAKYRQCVMMLYLYGLSYEELSAHMGSPVGSVKTWVHRGIHELGQCIGR